MRYNEKIAIKSLVRLVDEVNLRDIDIGKLEKTGDRYDLIVTGNQIYQNSTSKTLKRLGDNSSVIRTKYIENKTGIGIRTLLEGIQHGKEEIIEVINKIEDINRNKKVAVMIRDGTEVIYKNNDKWHNGKVKYTEAILNSESRIELNVAICMGYSNKLIHISEKEYLGTFIINSSICTEVIKKMPWSKSLLQVQNSGLISTVELSTKYGSIIMDNSCILHDGEIIGVWKGSILEIINPDEEVLGIVNKLEKIIGIHRKYIIPYGFSKVNKVVVEDSDDNT